jgi:subtilisin family serine protease
MFNRILVFLFVLFIGHQSKAQTQYAFRVSFKDKKETTFDLSKPNAFLSSKSIARRDLQSIAIDSNDLPVVQKYIDSVLRINDGIYHSRSRWQNNFVILVADSTKIGISRSLSFVKEITYVAIFLSPIHNVLNKRNEKGIQTIQPISSLFRTTGGIGYYGDAYDQIKLANGDYLHGKGFRGKNKTIAVIDEGFNLVNSLPGFDSLRKTGRIVDTYNFNLDTNDVYGYSNHGTQVLSTMAGILDGSYVGTAPDASYALYVSENGSSEQPFEMDNMVAAMERADSIGADIISISLGYNTFYIGTLDQSLSIPDIDGKSTIVAKASNVATQKGMLVVASAGNEGGNSWKRILTPGDADSALTCGSVNNSKIIASTSGRGPNASGIIKPDVCMLGAPGIVFNTSGTTSSVGGTSIATPELAGLAACLWESKPNATPYQLRKVIKESGHIASSPNNDLGYGVPDFGNAYKALNLPKLKDSLLYNMVDFSPNPVNEKAKVFINVTNPQGAIKWRIIDYLGKELTKGELLNNNNLVSFEIELGKSIPTGNYLFQIQSKDIDTIIKFQKL